MSITKEDTLVDVTQNYYDSPDADEFYYNVWGGEDIHVGFYKNETEPIADASRRTVETMADAINNLNADSVILDIGAGYGGAARFLASKYGCRVDCLNLSEAENKRNIEKNKEAGLNHLINVYNGNFEELPFKNESYDIVWCQDSILHSGEKEVVFAEAFRVLKKDGEFIFTDPMQADDTQTEILKPVLERIHLKEMGSVKKYKSFVKNLGLEEISIREMPDRIAQHYGRVLNELTSREQELKGKLSEDYISRMKKGLQNWVKFGNEGHLNWGILHFRKS
ncbi:MAG: methyltransferase domain-containing protein [Bacteroidetes bacterium]|jgi:sarcosine/dimethylglycine N-methyltransferase|nr:methyltransferase domain-containing protein [Bacteroidota bacterium]